MGTADYALIVSMFSCVVSLGGLWWNIRSKFIYPKARLRLSFAVMTVIGDKDHFEVISLSATNFGPTDVTVRSVICRYRLGWSWRSLRRPWQFGMLNTLHNFPLQRDFTLGPFSGGLPAKLPVGEQFTSHLHVDHEGLRESNIIDVGFDDIFGRIHWAPRKSVREVRRRVIEIAGNKSSNTRSAQAKRGTRG